MALLLLRRLRHVLLAAVALATAASHADAAECTRTALGIPPSYGMMTIADPLDGSLLLFGGPQAPELWRFPIDGGDGTWLREPVVGGPPVVSTVQGQVFDAARRRILLLGISGTWDEHGQFLPGPFEVWELPLAGERRWRPVPATGPAPKGRYGPHVVIDPATDSLFVVGGTAETLYPDYVLRPYREAWVFDLAAARWSQLVLNEADPPGLYDGQEYFSPEDRTIVMVAPRDSLGFAEEFYRRIWVLDLDGDRVMRRLRDLPDSLENLGFAPHYPDPDGSGGIVFAAEQVAGGIVQFQWTLDSADSGAWSRSELPSGPDHPIVQTGRVAFDLDRERWVLYGGRWVPGNSSQGAQTVVDVWSRDDVPGAPWSARYRSLAQSDLRWMAPPAQAPTRGSHFAAGRFEGLLTLETSPIPHWSSRFVGSTAVGTPPSRTEAVSVFDPAGGRFFVYGGTASQNVELGDLWSVAVDAPALQWTRHVPEGDQPTPRRSATAIHDPRRNRMILFGGFAGAPSDETWELDLRESAPTWRRLATRGAAPPPRFGHSAVLDTRRNAMVVFGGATGTPNAPTYLRDTWSLTLDDEAVWVPLPAADAPVARAGHLAAYDPIGDRMLLFGGRGNSGSRFESWQLGFGGELRWEGFFPVGGTPSGLTGGTMIYEAEADRLLAFGASSNSADELPVFQFDRPGAVPPPYPTVGAPLRLLGVGPNPTKGDVTIAFDLVRPAAVQLRVHDVRGRVVRDLGPRDFAAGPHALVFDGRNDAGQKLADGVYFARLVVEDQTITGKLVVMD